MSAPRSSSRAGLWGLALLPILLLAVLVVWIVQSRPLESLRGGIPPVETLAIQQVRLTPEGFEIEAINDGPDEVTVAQVQVDEAYWAFSIEPQDGVLSHLDRAVVKIPYPWVEGELHELRLLSSSGVTFDHTVEVAVESPRPGWKTLGLFALVGLYVGVLPVALGLLWYPVIRRLGQTGIDFVISLTIGLLLFLFVDAWHEGMEASANLPGSFQGIALLTFTALAAYLGIDSLGEWLRRRGGRSDAVTLALLVALGIGLHNFGEGLAIGAAFALGEVALGTLLVLGFTLHNTTEGLAIVAPFGEERASLPTLVLLGALAGVPTIAGAWIGGFVYSATWSVVFLGIGAGAIVQVVVQIALGSAKGRPIATLLRSSAVVSGLLLGVAVLYTTGLMVG